MTDWNKPEQVDAAIETMLRAEPMRAVPPGFGRKVKTRVALAAMLDWERQRWRYVGGVAGSIVLAVLGCILGAVLFPRMLELAVGYVMPGGTGYLDYLVSIAWYGGYSTAALVAVLVGVLLSSAFGLAFLIQRKSPGNRSWSPMGRS